MKRRLPNIFCAAVTFLMVSLWVGSYAYFRTQHSISGINASEPTRYILIHYDLHYLWARPMFYLHQPLAWIDQRTTGSFVEMRLQDFQGDRNNYPLERFN